jgi:hypothetical protein
MATSKRAKLEVYDLPDPSLRAYDRGVGRLSIDGELQGYLASVVGEIRIPGRAPWPWFVVVRLDGSKERPFEDYGPHWFTVRELDAGYFDHVGPSAPRNRRGWFGRTVTYMAPGKPCQYDFAWLPADEAAAKWNELGLTGRDF